MCITGFLRRIKFRDAKSKPRARRRKDIADPMISAQTRKGRIAHTTADIPRYNQEQKRGVTYEPEEMAKRGSIYATSSPLRKPKTGAKTAPADPVAPATPAQPATSHEPVPTTLPVKTKWQRGRKKKRKHSRTSGGRPLKARQAKENAKKKMN